MKTAINPIRVSISEAARLFGINPRTIRRAIAANELRYIIVQGRYKINFESLVVWSQQKTHVRNKSNRAGIGQYVDQWKIKNKLYSPYAHPTETPPSHHKPDHSDIV